MKRNSILANSSPKILKPIGTTFGVLQVRWMDKLDTHQLVLIVNGKETVIASHHNGFSCHSLAERMEAGNQAAIKDQADYIVCCGGEAKPVAEILALLDVSPVQLKLYRHKTDGGAEYLCSNPVKGTTEGSFQSRYIVRLDGAPTLMVKPEFSA